MKKLIVIMFAFAAVTSSHAQEKKQYEVKNFKGLININGPQSGLVVEGYSGTSVIIEAELVADAHPENASGLKVVTPAGLDNTGLYTTVADEMRRVVTSIDEAGKEVEEEVRVLSIYVSAKQEKFKNFKIRIPQGMVTRINLGKLEPWIDSSLLKIDGLNGELDVSCVFCNIDISKFSGNLVVNNSNFEGSTRIQIDRLAQDKISSIRSTGKIEVLLPENTPANLKLHSAMGNVYTDFDLVSVALQENKDPLAPVTVVGRGYAGSRTITGNPMYVAVGNAISQEKDRKLRTANASALQREAVKAHNFTINGGGVYLNVSSSGGDVLVRKN